MKHPSNKHNHRNKNRSSNSNNHSHRNHRSSNKRNEESRSFNNKNSRSSRTKNRNEEIQNKEFNKKHSYLSKEDRRILKQELKESYKKRIDQIFNSPDLSSKTDLILQDLKEKTTQLEQELKQKQLSSHNPQDLTIEQRAQSLVLDPWQKQALDYLNEGKNVVVDAPTTAGKTRIVEAFFYQNLNNPSFKAIYTTPIKSLSNDKLLEFRKKFGEKNVGIATGDIKDNLDAPIIIATLECYRNSLLGIDEDLSRNIIVFDEYHYIQDPGRGANWEQAIILSPENTQLLLLSASVGNPSSFVNWLTSIKKEKKCELIQTRIRPVPLMDLIYYKGSWISADLLDINENDYKSPRTPDVNYSRIASTFSSIIEKKLYPTIVYCGRRRTCSEFCSTITENITELNEEEKVAIKSKVEELDETYNFSSFITEELLSSILNYGVSYHHSGLAFPVKLLIEHLLKQGLLRFCVSTMGLSLGVDFSVRSALIVDMERPDEKGFITYDASEVLQMLGRAGRRGRDPVGYSLWWDIDSYLYLKSNTKTEVLPQSRNDATTFLGLIGKNLSLEGIEEILTKSFSSYDKKDCRIDFLTLENLRDYINKKNQQYLDKQNRKNKKYNNNDNDYENDISDYSQILKEELCLTPIKEYQRYYSRVKKEKRRSQCNNCEFIRPCHMFLEKTSKNTSFSGLHFHLHRIKALTDDNKLTQFGSIARYLPQSGGFVLAKCLADGSFNTENFGAFIGLMGAFSLVYYKKPNISPNQMDKIERRIGDLDFKDIQDMLLDFYPVELFPEMYDQKYGFYIYKEFNPIGAYIIKQWFLGEDFKSLEEKVSSEYFETGDLMSLIYRTAGYLQSLAQAGLGEISEVARLNRDILLRDPLNNLLS